MNNQDRFSQPLKLAADATRPEFSPELHARILESMERDSLVGLTDSAMNSLYRTRWLVVSIAAALLVAVGIGLRHNRPQAPAPRPSFLDTFEMATLSPAAIDETAIVTSEWDHLNHDLKAATQWWINEMPLSAVLE